MEVVIKKIPRELDNVGLYYIYMGIRILNFKNIVAALFEKMSFKDVDQVQFPVSKLYWWVRQY